MRPCSTTAPDLRPCSAIVLQHSRHGHHLRFCFRYSTSVPALAYPCSSKPPFLACFSSSSASASPDPVPPPYGSEDNEDTGKGGDVNIEVDTKVDGGKKRGVIRARIRVEADLETVWSVLTNYEGLADFIPSLVVSRLLHYEDGAARLLQVGQQDLMLGLKFNAKGVIDCIERDLEIVELSLGFGRRREIEFNMVEGDFRIFQGKWSIEQLDGDRDGANAFQTTLSYVVELEPKRWLPIQLVEGRLCKDIQINLRAVREESQRIQQLGSDPLSTC